jgi:F0F1-type ATP synthase alpha subunit
MKGKITKAVHDSVKEMDAIYTQSDEFSIFLSALDKYSTHNLLSKQNTVDIINSVIASSQDCALDFIALLSANLVMQDVSDADITSIISSNTKLLESPSLGKDFTDLTKSNSNNDKMLNMLYIIKLNLKSILFQYSALLEKNKK